MYNAVNCVRRLCFHSPDFDSAVVPLPPGSLWRRLLAAVARYLGKTTYGKWLSWIGRHARNPRKLNAAWHIKTTRKASAYESTAAFRWCGSSWGIICAVCLSAGQPGSMLASCEVLPDSIYNLEARASQIWRGNTQRGNVLGLRSGLVFVPAISSRARPAGRRRLG